MREHTLARSYVRRTVRLERVAAPKVAAVIEERRVLQIDEQAVRTTGGRACRLRALRAVNDHDSAGRRERRKEHTGDEAASHRPNDLPHASD
jgi:hypothetical protein